MIIKNVSGNILFLLILSSVFYLAKVTSFSPVYVLQPVLSVFLLAALYRQRKDLVIEKSLLFIMLFLFLFFALNSSIFSVKYSTFTNFFVGWLSFFAIVLSGKSMTLSIVLKKSILASKFILLILVTDSLYRITNPKMPSLEAYEAVVGTENSFYIFKFNTLMFADSNTTAIVAISFYFLLYYFSNRFLINVKWLSFGFVLVILSTLSRASIIALFFSIFIFTKRISNTLKCYLVMFFSLPLLTLVIFYITNDDSALSRLYILNKLSVYLMDASFSDLLFGVGLDNSQSALNGIYAHVHAITALVESGLLGLIMLLIFLFSTLIISKGYSFYIILPNFILGLSYFFYLGSPFVFVPLSLVVVLELLSKRESVG